jgi:hypothetical protein
MKDIWHCLFWIAAAAAMALLVRLIEGGLTAMLR